MLEWFQRVGLLSVRITFPDFFSFEKVTDFSKTFILENILTFFAKPIAKAFTLPHNEISSCNFFEIAPENDLFLSYNLNDVNFIVILHLVRIRLNTAFIDFDGQTVQGNFIRLIFFYQKTYAIAINFTLHLSEEYDAT